MPPLQAPDVEVRRTIAMTAASAVLPSKGRRHRELNRAIRRRRGCELVPRRPAPGVAREAAAGSSGGIARRRRIRDVRRDGQPWYGKQATAWTVSDPRRRLAQIVRPGDGRASSRATGDAVTAASVARRRKRQGLREARAAAADADGIAVAGRPRRRRSVTPVTVTLPVKASSTDSARKRFFPRRS